MMLAPMPPDPLPRLPDVPAPIAVFVGFTETAVRNGLDLTGVPTRVRSLGEHEQWFGGETPLAPDAVEVAPGLAGTAVVRRLARPFLYDSVRLFFDNGGRDCYVVSAGRFGKADGRAALERGLEAAEVLEAPAVFAVPDAIGLERDADRHAVQRTLLARCAARRTRFAILDLANLPAADAAADLRGAIGAEHLDSGAAYGPWLVSTYPRKVPDDVVAAAAKGSGLPPAAVAEAIAARLALVPPSGAVAGVYAKVDAARGVWKAPANVALEQVSGPSEAIDNAAEERLVADPTGGKAVNPIRQFPAKGTLVWGVRTLAGSSSDWKYVPVRRFVAMVEASVEQGTRWVVSEPNAPPLWAAVRAQIDDYLVRKWRDGALMGTKPEQAFFVRVGLGETMTSQDVLAGRLVIQIGLAVVRPAEFVIVRVERTVQGP